MRAHSTSPSTLRIVVIAGPQSTQPALLSALQESGAVHTVATVEDALSHLSANPADLVVAEPSTFQALRRLGGMLGSEQILERLGQGVCIVNRNGELVWANPRLRSYPANVIDQVRSSCAKLLHEMIGERISRDNARPRRRAISVEREFHFDVTASPLFGADDQIEQAVALIWDVTSTRRLQDKVNAIDAAGRELVRLDADQLADLNVSDRLALLEEKIIGYARELLRFTHFNVRVLDKASNRLDTVLASGMSEEAKNLTIYATTEGNGISGYVASTGRSYICSDVSKDPRYLPGLDNARSTLTVPLLLHDQVVGILNVESDEIAAFTEDDRQTAEIFARYIAIALHILRLLVVERFTTTGRIAADVGAELAAPLNDILAQTSTLMEDYIGHDDLRRRLSGIIDDVDRAKQAIRAITEAPGGVSGLVPEQTSADPLLDGKRVLIADDETAIRESIADILTSAGAVTAMAADGAEAIAMLHSQRFDLVLSDIRMPHKTGYEIFSAAREANAECPVILITGFGYDPHHSIVRAGQQGLTGVLFKPFKVDKLFELVHKALAPRTA
ncbi:MAG: response regulator [Planctomycetia bacterium]|nr:MAG: response regulator [Planctomycetia bacterium]